MKTRINIFLLLTFLVTLASSAVRAEDAAVTSSVKITFSNARYTAESGENYILPVTSGLFTVNALGKQVRFAKGNLQFNANSRLWKIAEYQWECLGTGGGNNVGTQDNRADSARRANNPEWIDLFPWATSGWDSNPRDKNNDFRPWARWYNDDSPSKFWIAGNLTNSFYQGSGYEEADWAYHNKIINGGNSPHIWRTLSADEWAYILRGRQGNYGWKALIMKASIDVDNGAGETDRINGLVLLPDDWQWKEVHFYNQNSYTSPSIATMAATSAKEDTTYYIELYGTWGTDNIFTQAEWQEWETRGAVFLPMAGYFQTGASVNSVQGVNTIAGYWTSSAYPDNDYQAIRLGFNSYLNTLSNCGVDNRLDGLAVRPVFDVVEAVPQTVDDTTLETYRETAACASSSSSHVAGYARITLDRYPLNINPKAKFVLSDGDTVIIAPSNLQYNAAKDLWRLAPKPWDVLTNSSAGGNTTSTGRDTQNKWIDLFSWGTSGWSGGVTNYQPWATETDNSKYRIAGNASLNMTGDYQHADWAWHNQIMNAGNADSLWRVMTADEVGKLLRTKRGTKEWWYFMCCGTVHDVKGVIFFPDDWRWDSINGTVGGYKNSKYYRLRGDCNFATENIITDAEWTYFESQGAVFFPLTGERNGTSVTATNYAEYWTSTYNNDNQARKFVFYHNDNGNSNLGSTGSAGQGNRYTGCAVRAVIDYNNFRKLKLDSVEYDWNIDDESKGTITVLHERGTRSFSLTATPNSGFLFTGWYTAGDELITKARTTTIQIAKGTDTISYKARFEPVACTKPSVVSSNTDMGTVTYSLVDSCNCEYRLTATPEYGYQFSHWQGAVTGIDVSNQKVIDIVTPYEKVAYYKAIFTTPDHDFNFENGGVGTMGDKRIRVDQSNDDGKIRIYAEADDDEVMSFWTLPDSTHTFGNPLVISASDLKDAIDARTASYTASYIVSDCKIKAWNDQSVSFYTTATDLGAKTAKVFIDGTEKDDFTVSGVNGVWTVDMTGSNHHFDDYTGKTMRIIYKNGSDIITAFEAVIPALVKEGETVNASALSIDENTKLAVLPGAKITFNEPDVTIAELDIYEGAEAVIPTGSTVHTYGVTLRADGTTGKSYREGTFPQLRVEGSLDNYNNDTIYFDYTINNKKYYSLILPYPVVCASGIRYADGSSIAGRFEIRNYDAAVRARTGEGWQVFNDSATYATLQPYAGYNIYAVPKRWNGNKNKLHPAAYVRFAMHADLRNGEPLKALPVVRNESTTEKLTDGNWNLIGNPYFYSFSADEDYMLQLSSVEPDSSGYEYNGDAGIRYISLPRNGFKGYAQMEIDDVDADIRMCNVFFVQTDTANNVSLQVVPRPAEAPAIRRIAASTDNGAIVEMPAEIKTGVTLAQGEQTDKTGLLLGDAFTSAYDYNADLVKLIGSNTDLQLFSLASSAQLAFCALPYAGRDTLVLNLPLGYMNMSVGVPAVFAFDRRRYKTTYIEHLYLTDNILHTTTDLLAEDYTFTPLDAASDTRFAITALARRINNATNEQTGGNVATTLNENKAAKAVMIFDMLGREYPAGTRLTQGVYIIVEGNTTRKEFIK